jgi:hypothetical protein
MNLQSIPKPLRDKLGEEASVALIKVLKASELEAKKEFATKDDLNEVKTDLSNKIFKVYIVLSSEIKHLTWMLGPMLAGIVFLVLKAFLI